MSPLLNILGPIAQLVERFYGIEEVRGSNPLGSTMKDFLRRFFGKEYKPLNNIYISKKNLLHNYKYLSSKNKNIKIAPVLKSNAYGHGIFEVGEIVDNLKTPFVCVDSIHEAYQLLQAKVKTPILIMGYVDPDNLKVKNLSFSYAVYNVKQIEAISSYQDKVKIHIKVDTGMHRLGASLEDLPDLLKAIKERKNVELEGVMSHLAFSRNPDNALTKKQILNFKKAVQVIEAEGFSPKWRHLGASGGVLNLKLPKILNMARVGNAFYGFNPGKTFDYNLKPALSFHTKVAAIKKVRRGEFVGYSATYKAKKDIVLGVLPVGYNDGIDRRLSNKGCVKIGNVFCPIVGVVSMNITTVDVSKVPNVKIGDCAIVYSDEQKDKNSIENSALICKTIPPVILVNLASSTKRQIV